MKRFLMIIISIILIISLGACNNATSLSNSGKKKFREGNYEEAVKDFKQAIDKNPNRADYYIEYGLTLIAQGKYEDAMEEFDAVYQKSSLSVVKSNNKRIHRGRGIAYYMMRDYEKALEEFQKALEINELSDLNVDIYYYMGSTYRYIGDYKKAVDSYSKLIKKDKKEARAYGSRAYCYQLLGESDKSLSDFDKAISLDEKNYDYYFGKYNLLIGIKKEEEANKVLTKASKIQGKSEEDSFNLAKIHYYQGNTDMALDGLNESITDGFDEANYYIGEIYRTQENYNKAIEYYEKYINSGKVSSPEVYNQAAVCRMKEEDYGKALELLNQGISFSDSTVMKVLKRNQIIAYEHMGNYDEANKLATKYLKDYPKDKEAVREAEFIQTRVEP